MTQLAGAIENARFLMELGPDKTFGPQPGLPPFIKGEPARSGSAEGQILFPNQNRKALLYGPDPSPSQYTKADFTAAIERTSEELKSLQERFAKRLPESASLIFTAIL